MAPSNQFKFTRKYINQRPNHYDHIIYENELKNELEVKGMCSDAIMHKTNCKWHILEEKATNIDKAIMQIENTLQELNGKTIKSLIFDPELCIIIAKKIVNSNKWRKSRKGHFLKDPNIRDQEKSKKKINDLYIKLVYHSQLLGNKKFPEDFDNI